MVEIKELIGKIKSNNKMDVPLKVDSDEHRNVVLSTKEDHCPNGLNPTVTLIGFHPDVLRKYSEYEVDKSLYDFKVFAEFISEKIRHQKNKIIIETAD